MMFMPEHYPRPRRLSWWRRNYQKVIDGGLLLYAWGVGLMTGCAIGHLFIL